MSAATDRTTHVPHLETVSQPSHAVESLHSNTSCHTCSADEDDGYPLAMHQVTSMPSREFSQPELQSTFGTSGSAFDIGTPPDEPSTACPSPLCSQLPSHHLSSGTNAGAQPLTPSPPRADPVMQYFSRVVAFSSEPTMAPERVVEEDSALAHSWNRRSRTASTAARGPTTREALAAAESQLSRPRAVSVCPHRLDMGLLGSGLGLPSSATSRRTSGDSGDSSSGERQDSSNTDAECPALPALSLAALAKPRPPSSGRAAVPSPQSGRSARGMTRLSLDEAFSMAVVDSSPCFSDGPRTRLPASQTSLPSSARSAALSASEGVASRPLPNFIHSRKDSSPWLSETTTPVTGSLRSGRRRTVDLLSREPEVIMADKPQL